MTDQQLENIVAGSSNDVWLITNHGGHTFCVASQASGGQSMGGGNSTVLVSVCL
jgi:hypothetical protein